MQRIMTLDLEYDFETKGIESLCQMPRLLSFFDDHHIRATFFILGELAEQYPRLMKKIARKHEIASHGYSHRMISRLSGGELEQEIRRSKQAITSLGIRCDGFRAPYLMVHPQLGSLLVKHGFRYDSSISTFFPGRYAHITAPVQPYHASLHTLAKRGNGIMELPIPNLTRFGMPPSALSYYRLLYPLSKTFRIPYLFYLHPCEFLETPIQSNISFLVRKLYSKNQGKKAWQIFAELVRRADCQWVSCREYLERYESEAGDNA